ncbi:MAG: hypothetical protein IJ109_05145 [Firmicutes bacterium]|nr:hypothetical protein [Bacillota bacterium]
MGKDLMNSGYRDDTINRIRRFTEERDWDQFHTPANLAKSRGSAAKYDQL